MAPTLDDSNSSHNFTTAIVYMYALSNHSFSIPLPKRRARLYRSSRSFLFLAVMLLLFIALLSYACTVHLS